MTSQENVRTNWQHWFTGDNTQKAERNHPKIPKAPEPYVVENEELVEAVNLAIHLQRPLLLEGEAGCGKTRLAMAIAYELGLPFYRWDIRSTSKAKEGLYEYDALLRLHDLQVRQVQGEIDRDPTDPEAYIRYGALGHAFRLPEFPAVVLIDEIDKADLDFPNDLLTVLDRPWEFEIPEVMEQVGDEKLPKKIGPATQPPIVIITSNRERKSLPLPFLRRCIYYYIKFPDRDGLKKIVAAHYPKPSEPSETIPARPDEQVIEAAADKLIALREHEELFKRPGTSEFLDWIAAMLQFGTVQTLLTQLRAESTKSIPFREVLIKVQKDWEKVHGVPFTPKS